jgi:hypothetical protein
MVMRAVSILVLVLALSPEVMAGEHPGTLRRMSCTAVRYYVALYSASAAEQFARSKGATAITLWCGRLAGRRAHWQIALVVLSANISELLRWLRSGCDTSLASIQC